MLSIRLIRRKRSRIWGDEHEDAANTADEGIVNEAGQQWVGDVVGTEVTEPGEEVLYPALEGGCHGEDHLEEEEHDEEEEQGTEDGVQKYLIYFAGSGVFLGCLIVREGEHGVCPGFTLGSGFGGWGNNGGGPGSGVFYEFPQFCEAFFAVANNAHNGYSEPGGEGVNVDTAAELVQFVRHGEDEGGR